jgi:hypothetical protein
MSSSSWITTNHVYILFYAQNKTLDEQVLVLSSSSEHMSAIDDVELGSSSSCDSLKKRPSAPHESIVFGSSTSSEGKCL